MGAAPMAGREHVVAEFRQAWAASRHAHRTLHVWGPGGMGKTRTLQVLGHLVESDSAAARGRLDFAQASTPRNAPEALWLLRRQLVATGRGLRCTRFDLIWSAWAHRNQLGGASAGGVFP